MHSHFALACLSFLLLTATTFAAPPPGYRAMTSDEIRAFKRRVESGEVWIRSGAEPAPRRASYVAARKRSVGWFRPATTTTRRPGSTLPWWPGAPGD